jgi:hypothetical protein
MFVCCFAAPVSPSLTVQGGHQGAMHESHVATPALVSQVMQFRCKRASTKFDFQTDVKSPCLFDKLVLVCDLAIS